MLYNDDCRKVNDVSKFCSNFHVGGSSSALDRLLDFKMEGYDACK
jgi:hypothetical protein